MVERFATHGVQFLFGIILARLLSPEDYGIIAMPLIFLAIAQCFIDSGFSTALIRKKTVNESDFSTAFYFNIAVGVVCYAILFITSPLIATFYNTPILSDILKITALATLFNPLCAVQQAVLTRRMDFKSQAIISLVSAIISGGIGVYMAYSGYGVWSLVVQQVGGYFLRTIFLWMAVKWRPTEKWSKESFEYLWGFGSKVLVQGLISNIYDNIYPIVIGKVYNAKDLGNYTRAQQFSKLPSVDISGVLFRVTLPVMSSIQDDDERLASVFVRMNRLTALCVFPIMLCLSAVADPLVRILLTDKWEGCIVLLQLMCFNLMWYPIHAFNLTILTAKGRSDLTLKLEIIKKAIGIIILIVTVPLGIEWMVGGGIVATFLCLVVNTLYTKKIINVGFFEQMRYLGPIFITSFLMWIVVRLFISLTSNNYVGLIGGLLLGFILYIILARLVHRKEIGYLIDILPANIKAKF